MEKFPSFWNVKNHLMTLWHEIVEAARNGEWGWIAIYFFVILTILVVSVSIVITAIGITASASSKVRGMVFAKVSTIPPKVITAVNILSRSPKDGNDLYRTALQIVVHTPASNPFDTILESTVPDAECIEDQGYLAVSDVRAGLASTTEYHGITCLSRESILNPSNLFRLGKN